MLKWTLDLLNTPGGHAAALGLLGVLFFATLTDLRERRIPNSLTLSAAMFALVLHGVCAGVSGLLASAAALMIALAFGMIYYSFSGGQGIGAGDIKLMAACAAMLGLRPALYLAFFSFAGQVLWMLAGWLRSGLFLANGRKLVRFLVHLLAPGASPIHFVPAGTPAQSPHAPFMLGSGIFMFALWHARLLPF